MITVAHVTDRWVTIPTRDRAPIVDGDIAATIDRLGFEPCDRIPPVDGYVAVPVRPKTT